LRAGRKANGPEDQGFQELLDGRTLHSPQPLAGFLQMLSVWDTGRAVGFAGPAAKAKIEVPDDRFCRMDALVVLRTLLV
jgi:hypothetical protein